ncbi:hypothetical protein PPERSA_02339 [Pseudocohnilembus persalinus]|uniref:Uncharacterized protein n=1 Tax=Pseudocohnilembus persalinus TaxID=266149 RepID=A0A0V0QU43_PSEPJ|nr:hypothetical protein PPERSA_02339 [Pseudocohnilembus persalinus]|eukprot:KRX05807.1 hypothetical protein PPERSA_02339 [Pseudocohnilembus persalinus]
MTLQINPGPDMKILIIEFQSYKTKISMSLLERISNLDMQFLEIVKIGVHSLTKQVAQKLFNNFHKKQKKLQKFDKTCELKNNLEILDYKQKFFYIYSIQTLRIFTDFVQDQQDKLKKIQKIHIDQLDINNIVKIQIKLDKLSLKYEDYEYCLQFLKIIFSQKYPQLKQLELYLYNFDNIYQNIYFKLIKSYNNQLQQYDESFLFRNQKKNKLFRHTYQDQTINIRNIDQLYQFSKLTQEDIQEIEEISIKLQLDPINMDNYIQNIKQNYHLFVQQFKRKIRSKNVKKTVKQQLDESGFFNLNSDSQQLQINSSNDNSPFQLPLNRSQSHKLNLNSSSIKKYEKNNNNKLENSNRSIGVSLNIAKLRKSSGGSFNSLQKKNQNFSQQNSNEQNKYQNKLSNLKNKPENIFQQQTKIKSEYQQKENDDEIYDNYNQDQINIIQEKEVEESILKSFHKTHLLLIKEESIQSLKHRSQSCKKQSLKKQQFDYYFPSLKGKNQSKISQSQSSKNNSLVSSNYIEDNQESENYYLPQIMEKQENNHIIIDSPKFFKNPLNQYQNYQYYDNMNRDQKKIGQNQGDQNSIQIYDQQESSTFRNQNQNSQRQKTNPQLSPQYQFSMNNPINDNSITPCFNFGSPQLLSVDIERNAKPNEILQLGYFDQSQKNKVTTDQQDKIEIELGNQQQCQIKDFIQPVQQENKNSGKKQKLFKRRSKTQEQINEDLKVQENQQMEMSRRKSEKALFPELRNNMFPQINEDIDDFQNNSFSSKENFKEANTGYQTQQQRKNKEKEQKKSIILQNQLNSYTQQENNQQHQYPKKIRQQTLKHDTLLSSNFDWENQINKQYQTLTSFMSFNSFDNQTSDIQNQSQLQTTNYFNDYHSMPTNQNYSSFLFINGQERINYQDKQIKVENFSQIQQLKICKSDDFKWLESLEINYYNLLLTQENMMLKLEKIYQDAIKQEEILNNNKNTKTDNFYRLLSLAHEQSQQKYKQFINNNKNNIDNNNKKKQQRHSISQMQNRDNINNIHKINQQYTRKYSLICPDSFYNNDNSDTDIQQGQHQKFDQAQLVLSNVNQNDRFGEMQFVSQQF